MPNYRYDKGARGERIVRAYLEERGWLVLRAWASKGPFDLIGVRPLPEDAPVMMGPSVWLIEVKNGPTARMGPEARERLNELAHQYGAVPVRAHYARKVPGLIEWTNVATGLTMAAP